jgi:hypothetical protein
LAASEDDDDRFAKRRQFFEKFVAQQGLHKAHFKVSVWRCPSRRTFKYFYEAVLEPVQKPG